MSWNGFNLEGFQMIEKNELINTLYSEFIKNYSSFWENTKNVCHKFIKSAILLLKFFDFKNIFVGRCKCWDIRQKKRFFILIQKIWCFGLRRSEEIAFEVKMPFSNSGNSDAISMAQRGHRCHIFYRKRKQNMFTFQNFYKNQWKYSLAT